MIRALLRKMSVFTVVGVASALLYAASVFVSVDRLRLNPFLGQGVGLVLAGACSYFGHHALTFKVNGRHDIYAPRFIIQATLTAVLSTALLGMVTMMGVDYMFCVFGTITIIPAVNFMLMQYWVFKRPSMVSQNASRE